MGDDLKSFKNKIVNSFQNIKMDLEALRIQIQLLKAENERLKEKLNQLIIKQEIREEKERKEESQQESQASLSETELRLIIEKILAEALKQKNTKESSVLRPVSIVKETITPEDDMIIKNNNYYEEKTRESDRREEKTKIKEEKKDTLKEDLIKTYERNRKKIIKQQILAEINKNELTRIELRDIIVNNKKYCSKASFYRYLEELELEGLITEKKKKKRTILKPIVYEKIIEETN